MGKNNETIPMMKDVLGGKIVTEFVALRPKMYGYRKLDKEVDNKCCIYVQRSL